MNGSLDVQSDEGKGSCFSITLPASTGISPLKEPESAIWPEFFGHGNQDGSFKILYIEDNPENMELIASILDRRNLQLFQAPDTKLGIELAKIHQPDLVLMDIDLPGMDGYEALKTLRTDPSFDSTPIIALSANGWNRISKKGCQRVSPIMSSNLLRSRLF